MVAVTTEAKNLINTLATAFEGFTALTVLSEEYVSRVQQIDEAVFALSEMHPRWSEADKTVRPFSDDEWDEYEQNPLFSVFELTGDLLWAWKRVSASEPTIESLAALRFFSPAVYALTRKASTL